MAVTSSPTDGSFDQVIVSDSAASSAAAEDLFDGSCTVYDIFVDNSAHGTDTYLKVYDLREVDPSSDVPLLKLLVDASKTLQISIPDGWAFTNGCSFRAVTGAADTDTTSPGSNVPVFVVGV